MSDGAISPEGPSLCKRGFYGKFQSIQGGSLTSNFFITHVNYDEKIYHHNQRNPFQIFVKTTIRKLINGYQAQEPTENGFKDDPEAETSCF